MGKPKESGKFQSKEGLGVLLLQTMSKVVSVSKNDMSDYPNLDRCFL